MQHQICMPTHYPVTCHTKYVGHGSTFVAIKGMNDDGMLFISQALEKGAKKIVVHNDVEIQSHLMHQIYAACAQLVRVDDTRKALAELSAYAAGNPAKKLRIIGITGTKGKTTTTFICAHLLRQAGYKTAFMSTVKNTINDCNFPAPLTTAQPDYLQQFLKLCADEQVDYVVMEVAAQALTLHRVHGIAFDGVIFTNFGLEHLEFYKNMDDYFAAKCLLLAQRKPHALALINADDRWCAKLKNNYSNMVTFGCHQADFTARASGNIEKKLAMTCIGPDDEYSVSCPALMGRFNLYNVLAAQVMALLLGVSPQAIQKAVQTFAGVPGRLQRHLLPNGAMSIIDYAHNPLSYRAVLSELRKLTKHLIVVFGAGGYRDASRRPLMGKIAAEYADRIVLTSDNPRTEDPESIIEDIFSGISHKKRNNVMHIVDREQAIRTAYSLSKSGSIIAVLGKGPDEYQIVGVVKRWFSDSEIIKSLSENS